MAWSFIFLCKELYYIGTIITCRLFAITLSSWQCIASTTIDEYRIHFEKDKALARRFQPVWVDEPSEVAFHIHVYILS